MLISLYILMLSSCSPVRMLCPPVCQCLPICLSTLSPISTFSFRHLIPLILFCHCPLSMSFCPSELLLFIVMCLLRFPFYSVRAITFHYIVCIYFLFLTTLPISTYVCLFIFPSQRWVIDKWCHFEIELDIRLAGKELINKRSISLLLTWTL